MILVDSSVWIDFIQGQRNVRCDALEQLLEEGAPICLNSLVLTEVLRGSRSAGELEDVTSQFRRLPFLELEVPHDHIDAALLYRSARAFGVTTSGLADLLIAATCIKFNATLLHNYRDFDQLAKVTDLKVWQPAN